MAVLTVQAIARTGLEPAFQGAAAGGDPTRPPYTATYASVPPYSSTNGERRCRLNLVLDTPQSLMEAVSDLAFLGYCFATLQGAKWRFTAPMQTQT